MNGPTMIGSIHLNFDFMSLHLDPGSRALNSCFVSILLDLKMYNIRCIFLYTDMVKISRDLICAK